jgi:hypothetical protein
MSIITEALKKAEKEREKAIVSKEYMNKILGPERKATYKRGEPKIEKPKLRPKAAVSKNESIEFLHLHYVKSKTLIVAGILLLSTIIFLAIINIFLIPSPEVKVATSVGTSEITEAPVRAEAYTDMKSEIHETDFVGKMARVLRSDLVQNGVLSSFKLNGIVYDDEDSWAVINNKVARVGDALDGATVISIAPQRVTILFQNKRYDLAVR